jgi:hypothetical protein
VANGLGVVVVVEEFGNAATDDAAEDADDAGCVGWDPFDPSEDDDLSDPSFPDLSPLSARTVSAVVEALSGNERAAPVESSFFVAPVVAVAACPEDPMAELVGDRSDCTVGADEPPPAIPRKMNETPPAIRATATNVRRRCPARAMR